MENEEKEEYIEYMKVTKYGDQPKRHCLNCGHIWKPHKPDPKICPNCKRYIIRKVTSKEEGVKEEKPITYMKDTKYGDQPIVICHKCGHKWKPYKPDPKKCPSCKSLIESKVIEDESEEKV